MSLTLTAGVGGADELIGRAKQTLDDRKLFPRTFLVDHLELEALGNEGKPLERPVLQCRVVVLRLLEHRQVPKRPAHLITAALEVSVAPR